MRTIDTRGLSCPQPLVMLNQALAEDDASDLDVLVDNQASLENVSRAAGKRGFTVSVSDAGDGVSKLELRK